ncbi:chromosome partitioning protein [Micromonospora sp. ALFpr18c]|uniref:MinD/ParA family ATP-binding protein n=1 Tax=unclassified Micromonospora TaxID=2617518 RepID=UPI00124B82A0|nr:chromosome partitioning protein [Micromonospora sp. ALFpr18c]KAB1937946.1 chromosome partitioning protein [Micromonospora sp. ALFpr18c]
MDENADRARKPGQQPVPERDIEPLWPPDPADAGAGGVVPPWAAVAEQRGAPPTTAQSPVTPPVAAPPIGRPPVPGQPGAPAMPPPSPSDYPSLTGAVPAPGGWGVNSPGSGWAPAQPSWPPPADPAVPTVPPNGGPTTGPTGGTTTGSPRPASNDLAGGVGVPTPGTPVVPKDGAPTPQGTSGSTVPAPPIVSGGVDLDLPFSLDRPAAEPATNSGAGGNPRAASPNAAGPNAATAATAGPATPAPAGTTAGDTTAAGPTTTDGPATAARPAAGPTTAAGSAAATGSATAGGTAAAATAPVASQGGDAGEDGSAVSAARPTAESPWAYPPQRPASAPEPPSDAAATPPPPIPAPPSVPPPLSGGPAVPQAGGAQTYTGQSYSPTIPGQVPLPPPPDPSQFGDPAHGGAVPPQAGPATPPPGPFPPSPGWYPPPWQQGTPGVPPPPPQYQEADGVTRVPATGYPDAAWAPESTAAPTAEDFARRRQVRPPDPVATMGVRAVVNKMGLLRLSPGRHEQELKRDIEMVRRNFGGLRQVTVVNPKGGAGKTVAILLLAMTFGQKRGGYVLAWDNNETQGTLGMRAQQDFHSRTVRDMLRDLGQFQGAHGRVGDLSQYVRSQGEGMFDVLASDESATGGEMLTAAAFAEIREVVSRFYKLIFVDTGNNVRAQNWQASMDATDQLVVTMSARNDSAETAARMLDHLEQSGRQRLVRQAVTVVSMPPSRKEIDLPAIQEHFAARTRAVLLAPYERLIDSGEPIRYGGLSSATRDAWLKIAAAVAEGL